MRLKSIYIFIVSFFVAGIIRAGAQCSVSSSHGWTVTLEITPTAIIPEFTDCPWYYHYEVQFDYIVTFTGSTNNRSFNGNAYFECTGGVGGTPYRSLGNFTGNASGTSVTNNNTRQYNAVGPAYNYGANPDCNSVTVANTGCNDFRLDYWGSGISNGSISCPVSAPLPVTLLNFEAVAASGSVELKWSTASEINNQHFIVERSKELTSWEEITQLSGAGNTTAPQYYVAADDGPYSGISYYRLKQVDFDGKYVYSNVISVNLTDQFPVEVFPNPVSSKANIKSSSYLLSANLRTEVGQLVRTPEISRNNNTYSFSTESIQPGVYLLEMIFDTGFVTKKLIVVR